MRSSLRAALLRPAGVAAATLWLVCAGSGAQFEMTQEFSATPLAAWSVAQGHWQVRDGCYHADGTGQSYLDGVTFGDVRVQVDCTITDYGKGTFNWAGILIGADSRASSAAGYLVYVRYSGAVELYRAGKILAQADTPAQSRFEAGQSVSLSVQVRGREVTVQVDGKTFIQQDAPEYAPGNVALSVYDVEASFDNLKITGDRLGNMIVGQVLHTPSNEPVPGVEVEVYDSMDEYNSPVTRSTRSDERGRFELRDLPTGEKAYWLRAGKPGYGGTTGWFLSVSPDAPTKVDLYLIPPPPSDIWLDSADIASTTGFTHVEDLQSFGGSRLEVKQVLSAPEAGRFIVNFEFTVQDEGDYIPRFAAGIHDQPHYWSDFWWSLDGGRPQSAAQTLTIEGPRYGDRSAWAWSSGAPVHLSEGSHRLSFMVRDPAPHDGPTHDRAYWGSVDAVAFTRIPGTIAPTGGRKVSTGTPELRWSTSSGAGRYTLQYSSEPHFNNATVTVGGLAQASYTVPCGLADGEYYWRVKPLPESESPYGSSFTPAERFRVSTPAPAIEGVRVAKRGPDWAVIRWRTDEPCMTRLRWGLSGIEPTRAAPASGTPRRLHEARLTGLAPMTYHYYWVEATDGEGNTVTSLRRGLCTSRGPIAAANSPFGMFGQGLTYIEEMSRAGVAWYSDYWDWGTLEPQRGAFAWAQAEERMTQAEQAGVRLSVTFWGSPAWCRPSHPNDFTYGPDDVQDAREFFEALAAHCKGRTDWWVPWIEPNVARDPVFGFLMGYWANRPHARSYAAYQRAAYEGAKAGDPDCKVVGMNTAGVDLNFIRKCYDEGAADSFDVMNVHYYAMSAPFEQQNPEALFERLREVMSEYGDSEKPILCSEGGGASSGLPGTDEDSQADNLIRIYVISIANNIDKLCWTFERDVKPYGSKRTDMIMWMGLFRFDPEASPGNPSGAPKPAYFAMQTMTRNLIGAEYVGRVGLGPGVRAYRFDAPDRRVTVVWAEEGQVEAAVPVASRSVTVIDRTGAEQTLSPTDGMVPLHLTGSPVFVTEVR